MNRVLVVVVSCLLLVLCCHAAKQQEQQQQQQSYNTRVASRRERNLDHWDADTLAYYLGVDETTGKVSPDHHYPGHDAAVLFYAQWCQNCHALAPSWDAIATHLKAGSASSSLIMALFDCEYNARHESLCNMAGVQHYPTLLFLGNGHYQDTDIFTRTLLGKKRSVGPAGPSPIPHSVKFQGQWQYADSILDWIRLMQGLSRWHQWTSTGILRYIRNGLLGFLRPKPVLRKLATPASLPVGIPGISSNDVEAQTHLLESKLVQSEKDSKLMEKAATHASLLLDAVLTPNATVDMFTVMNETNAYDVASKNPVDQVVRNCFMELVLDYCQRVTTQVANDYILEVPVAEMPSMEEMTALLKKRIATKEPYCSIADEYCFAHEFEDAKCRPKTCPFQQPAACSYVAACMDPTIQKEYAIALQLIAEGDEFPPQQTQEASPKKTKKKGAWGF